MKRFLGLILFSSIILLSSCSKDKNITLLCITEILITFDNNDNYLPVPGYEEQDAKIYISFSFDQIGISSSGIEPIFDGIIESSESYTAIVKYDEDDSMYKSGYKSRSISIDRLTLNFQIYNFFTPSYGNGGNIIRGSCKKGQQQI